MWNKHNLALKLDSLGVGASVLCAIHCALFPFFILLLAYYGMQDAVGPVFEVVFVSISVCIGAFTLTHGYKKHHRKFLPTGLFVTGLGLIMFSHFILHSHTHETDVAASFDPGFIISPLGAFFIASAHFINRRMSAIKSSKQCCNAQNTEEAEVQGEYSQQTMISYKKSS